MDRLTVYLRPGVPTLKNMKDFEAPLSVHICLQTAIGRLAAYEDTGVEPDAVLTAKEMAQVACFINAAQKYRSGGQVERPRELEERDTGKAYPPKTYGWVSMKDRHPPEEGSYIVRTKPGAVCTAHYAEKARRFGHTRYGVTHWMYLPLPPERE